MGCCEHCSNCCPKKPLVNQPPPVPDVQLPPMNFTRVHLRPLGQTVDWGYDYVDAGFRPDQTRGGENALVFILDTGISAHVDLDANRRQEYDANFTPDKEVRHPHGTHCAGIAAAVDNKTGIIGVAPKAGLVDVQVLNGNGSGSYGGITQGILYVANLVLKPEDQHKRKIISMSLGGGSPYAPMHDAIKYAISKNVIVVAAAGNSGYSPGQSRVGWPGRYAEVITVAALDRDDDDDALNQKPASYSSSGPEVDITAPGSQVLSTVLNNGYARFSGTSMACPHMAGFCALLVTYRNDLSAITMEGYLREFATDLLAKGHDVRTGFGAPILRDFLNDAPAPPPDKPTPDPNPDPTPPDDPKPPPEKPTPDPTPPDDKPYHPRRYVMPFQIKDVFQWKHDTDDSYRNITFEASIVWKTNLKFEDANDIMQKITRDYFDERMYIFKTKTDMWRLHQVVRRLYRDHVRNTLAPDAVGIGVISLTDENGRVLRKK